MKINFKEVTIQNFMSIGEATIKLSDRGYTLVSGVNNNITDQARSNGSGKSSIFEAIVWCLTGETMRGNKDVVNRYGNDGTVVNINFTIDSHEYVITRTKDHSKYKTNLLIHIDGEDKSGKGIRDSEKLLKEYLPDLTPSLIGSVIILGQGLPTRFTNNSPSGRKEVLEKLCKSDFMIEDLKNRISSRKNSLQSDLRSTEDNILMANTKLNVAKCSLENNKEMLVSLKDNTNYESTISELTASKQENEETLKQVQQELNGHKNIVEASTSQLLLLNKQKTEKLQELENSFSETVDNLRNQINNVNSDITSYSKEITRINNIKDICPTCKQKLPDVHKPDTSELEKQLQNCQLELQKYTAQMRELNTTIDSKKSSIDAEFIQREKESNQQITIHKTGLNDCESKINSLLKLINEQNNKITELRINLENLQKNILECEERISQDNLRIDVLENELLYNNNVKSDIEERLQVINKFNTIITRDFRGYLLSNFIEFINNKSKEYCKDIFGTELIEFKLDGNNILISYNEKQYEALSGGERQKVDIIIQFSIRDMLCRYTNFSTNLLVLDEIFDNLDDLGSQKIIDLISTKLLDISTICIISHHGSELNIPYDNEIIVMKNNNGVSSIT